MKKSVLFILVILFAFSAIACDESNDENKTTSELTKVCKDANTLESCYKGQCSQQTCPAGCTKKSETDAVCNQQEVPRPENVPATCKLGDKGICGTDGNAWLCNPAEAKYYTTAALACTEAAPCKVCSDGTAGCDISCPQVEKVRPANVPETCDKCVISGMCGDDHNGWLCGNDGTFYSPNNLTCPDDKPCVDCDGYIGCGIVCDPPKPANLPESCNAGDPGICDPSGLYAWTCDAKAGTPGKYKLGNRCSEEKPCVKCDDGYVGCVAEADKDSFCHVCTNEENECYTDGSKATVCDSKYHHLKTWTCANNECSINEDKTVNCPNACNKTAERPANVPETCQTNPKDPGICGDDGNAWFCGNDGKYFLNNSGKCTEDAPCVVCPDGYAGCNADEATFCNGHKGRPSNVPATCVKNQDPGICGHDGNAYYCTNNGTYRSNTCTPAAPCVLCNDGYSGCDANAETFCANHGGVKSDN